MLQGQQGHGRLGLADDLGLAACGPEEHPAHAAAVRHRAIPGGADPVGIGGDVVHPPAQQDAGVLQLLECQLRVKPHQQAVDLILQPVRDRHARLRQLPAKGAGAKGIALPVRRAAAQLRNQRIYGGEEILPASGDAHPGQLLPIGVHGLGRVVGQEQISPAARPDGVQKWPRTGEQLLVQIDGPVHIQQEQPLFS